MMTLVFTLVLAIIISGLLFILFRWIKTPIYRVDEKRMIQILEKVITGQAIEHEWHMTFGMIIRHYPELEAIRQKCQDIEEAHLSVESNPPYLFTKAGIMALEPILEELKALEAASKY